VTEGVHQASSRRSRSVVVPVARRPTVGAHTVPDRAAPLHPVSTRATVPDGSRAPRPKSDITSSSRPERAAVRLPG
jgi:hypothetical protein